jgi:ornithine cyclodeaminase
MEVLILNQTQVQELLPINECMDVMAQILKSLAEAKVGMPLRSVMWLPDKRGAIGMMPSYALDLKIMGLKIISVFPGNHGTQYDSHQGAVMLFETENGRPLALVDASAITAIRTPAVSALATRLLARPDAGDLAILGSGIQARGHLEAMLQVRKIRRVRVWSLPVEQARQFAAASSQRLGIRIEAMEASQDAVKDADIICTVTAAPEPVLFGKSVSDGAHINAIGACVPSTRELDTAAVLKSRLYVDRRESTLNEAGDFLIPKKEGTITDKHIIGEIGEILAGKVSGRQSEKEITLFKSLGLAVEDLAAAHYVYRKALEKKVGTVVELGGKRLV